MSRILCAAGLLLFSAAAARALELSLEENRAQRGNIGYVDIQRVFKKYPETIRAKENFEDVVRQAEEQLNLRKAEIIRLRSEIFQLKLEHEAAAKAAPAALAAPQASSTDTTADLNALLVPNLPGVSTSAVRAAIESAPPEPEPAPSAPPGPLAVLDEKIAAKTQELERKQAEYKDREGDAEKNLLDLESKKTEILLGKIHKAIKEVARREGVSVVVDKSGILFGQDAVDLTERVLKELKGS